MKLNILPNPKSFIKKPGGVSSVIRDHLAGFLLHGVEITETDADLNIVHALSGSNEHIDVFHSHGLYPIGNGKFGANYSSANSQLITNALKARKVICISEFSADIYRKMLHIDPIVTRNGIWVEDYKKAGSPTGPILFPKISLDANAVKDDVVWLSEKDSKIKLSSIAPIPNIKSVGKLSREEFIEYLGGCSIYLGTTKENNSMATMEAMIMGIPVAGYDIGFNSEWLISGSGCELVPYGDREGLYKAIKKIQGNWNYYSEKAREFGHIFDWNPIIDQLLGIYKSLIEEPEEKSVSIVIPNHNYERYVGEAIQSCLNQTYPCEIIIVDDKSTDNSVDVIQQYPVTLIRNKFNCGVARTRNAGIEQASGNFIVCLDADDTIAPTFVETLINGFVNNNDAICFSPIVLMKEDGTLLNKYMFTDTPIPNNQGKGLNQVPSCCMFRKSFWKRAGGYEKQYTPAEDANLWHKIMCLGGVAKKVTNNFLMNYRVHDDSLSADGRFPNWYSSVKPSILEPVTENDPAEILIKIKTISEQTQETLWSLENQTFKKWVCQIERPNGMQKSFPWINRLKNLSKNHSVINLEPGVFLNKDFLMNMMNKSLLESYILEKNQK